MDHLIFRDGDVYMLIAPLHRARDDLSFFLYTQTLFDKFMKQPHPDVYYLFRGRLFTGMTVEYPDASTVMLAGNRSGGGGRQVVYGNPNIPGSPIRVPIAQAPCYVKITEDTFDSLRRVFDMLSVRDRRRVVSAVPWLREREMAWRMAMNRAVPRDMRSFTWDRLDLTQVHSDFYADILSSPHDDVQFKFGDSYYKGVVKQNEMGQFLVFASDPMGPQGVSLEDAPVYVKTYGSDGTGSTLATLVAKGSNPIVCSFGDLAI